MNFCSKLIRENSIVGIRKSNGDVLTYEKLMYHKKVATLTMETVNQAMMILKKRDQQEKYNEVMSVRQCSQASCPHCFEMLESIA